MTKGCVANFQIHKKLYAAANIDVAKVDSARRLRDFDKALTIQAFGYDSVEAYYKDASSRKAIPGMSIMIFHNETNPNAKEKCSSISLLIVG